MKETNEQLVVSCLKQLNLPLSTRVEEFGNGNTGAALVRVHLSVDSPQQPSTLVFKITKVAETKFSPALRSKVTERGLLMYFGYSDSQLLEAEVNFYSKIRPIMATGLGDEFFATTYYTSLKKGKLFPATLNLLFGRKPRAVGVIVMEDLDQWGTFHSAVSPDVDFEVIRSITIATARFSGCSVQLLKTNKNIPRNICCQYLVNAMTSGILLTIKRLNFKRGTSAKVKALWSDTALKCLNDDPEIMLALESFEKHFPKISKFISRKLPFKCLVHGDLHAANFVYQAETQKVKMIDMQMYGIGSPPVEMAYFLSSNVQADNLQREAELLELYHTHFIKESNITNYSLEDFTRGVHAAVLDFTAAFLVRRAMFETPDAVNRAINKHGEVARDLQRVIGAREINLLKRVKEIWKRNPEFDIQSL